MYYLSPPPWVCDQPLYLTPSGCQDKFHHRRSLCDKLRFHFLHLSHKFFFSGLWELMVFVSNPEVISSTWVRFTDCDDNLTTENCDSSSLVKAGFIQSLALPDELVPHHDALLALAHRLVPVFLAGALGEHRTAQHYLTNDPVWN